MKIVIAGGSGFIGRALTKEFIKLGHDLFILTRNPGRKEELEKVTYLSWSDENNTLIDKLENTDVFINLAGENLSNGRWTPIKKEQLLQSRLGATEKIVHIIQSLQKKPKLLLNASAIGYYGTSLSKTFTESTDEKGDDFLAHVVTEWETLASQAEEHTRVVYARFGIVLDKDEGALNKMLIPFKLFIGGKLGSGEQWMSWIHKDDVVRGIIHCIENTELEGPVNFTAPTPVKMKEFSRILAKVMRRPHWAPVPSFILKTILGEMSILVLEGQRVLPNKLISSSFSFQYTDLQQALKHLLSDQK